MNTCKEILRDHIRYRRQILKLAKADLIKTYKGAALGWAWAVIRPTITIGVYYFAFSVGLRKGAPVSGYPFFLWMLCGMLPWFYISSVFSSGAGVIRRYSYLVTKIRYPVSTIPTFFSLSQLSVNLFLTVIVMVIFMMYGVAPDIYWLQLPVYILMNFLFFTAWTLFAGMLSVISKDFMQLVHSSTVALFWLSGILYDARWIEQSWLRKAMLLNPVTIIVNGYRNCFIEKVWFWENPAELRNFIIIFAVMVMLAVWVYKKLVKVIPDVM